MIIAAVPFTVSADAVTTDYLLVTDDYITNARLEAFDGSPTIAATINGSSVDCTISMRLKDSFLTEHKSDEEKPVISAKIKLLLNDNLTISPLWFEEHSIVSPYYTYEQIGTFSISKSVNYLTITLTFDELVYGYSNVVGIASFSLDQANTEAAKLPSISLSLSETEYVVNAALTYVDPPACADPTFSIDSGAYLSAQSLTLSCATEGATIRYTTDGTEPTESSPAYSSALIVSTTGAIKAKAFKAGCTPSGVVSKSYTIFEMVVSAPQTPTFSVPEGIYTTTQNVTISCATDGATIRYTTDGTEPTETSPNYSTPIAVSETTTLKAKAFKIDCPASALASATYTMVVLAPHFELAGGTYTSEQNITISCATEGATIRYTTDGSFPTESSPIYSAPFPLSASATLMAMAFKTGMESSAAMSETYVFDIPPVIPISYTVTVIENAAAPSFSVPAGTYSSAQKVALSCSTEGAAIRFTADGTEPTESSEVYSEPISVSETATIKAKAFKDGMEPSAAACAVYTIKSEATEYELTGEKPEPWKLGSAEGLEFVTDGDPEKLTGVQVDGNTLPADMFIVEADRAAISLRPSYLDGLSAGTHTLRINFTDGGTEVAFTVSGASDNPETGVGAPLALPLFAAITAFAGFYGRKRLRK